MGGAARSSKTVWGLGAIGGLFLGTWFLRNRLPFFSGPTAQEEGTLDDTETQTRGVQPVQPENKQNPFRRHIIYVAVGLILILVVICFLSGGSSQEFRRGSLSEADNM